MTQDDPVVIRPAEPGDLDALLAIENEVFATDRLSRRAFRHSVRAPTIAMLAALRGPTLLGYVLVHRRRDSDAARLTSIAVSPEAAGCGLGTRLLQAAEDEARRHGAARLRLEVRKDNRVAQELYRKAGYRRFAEVGDYYEDGATAWRYEKDLAQEASREKRSTSRRSSTKRRAP